MSSHPASSTVPDAAAAEHDERADSTPDALSSQVKDDELTVAQAALVAAGQAGGTVVELDPPAVELARSAAVSEAGSSAHVGEFQLAVAEDDVAVTVTFTAAQPGYLGWLWSVTLAVLAAQPPTVSEVVLLPGDGALLAPVWIPWDERIRPGDLGVGDLLPPIADDPRLVPAYLQSDDPAVEAVAVELGIGRVRVMSREGRVDFAERLHDGTFGPSDDMALAAPAHCFTCAFYLPLAGSLGALLGACGNELAPADGRVVDAGYGCGAHSETVIEMPARSAATDTVIDELSLEVHRRPTHPGRAAIPGDEVEQVEFVDLDEWADPYLVGAELATAELAEAAMLDADPLDADVLDADVLDADPLDADALDPDPLDADVLDVDMPDADVLEVDVLDADAAEVDVVEASSADEPTPEPEESTS